MCHTPGKRPPGRSSHGTSRQPCCHSYPVSQRREGAVVGSPGSGISMATPTGPDLARMTARAQWLLLKRGSGAPSLTHPKPTSRKSWRPMQGGEGNTRPGKSHRARRQVSRATSPVGDHQLQHLHKLAPPQHSWGPGISSGQPWARQWAGVRHLAWGWAAGS